MSRWHFVSMSISIVNSRQNAIFFQPGILFYKTAMLLFNLRYCDCDWESLLYSCPFFSHQLIPSFFSPTRSSCSSAAARRSDPQLLVRRCRATTDSATRLDRIAVKLKPADVSAPHPEAIFNPITGWHTKVLLITITSQHPCQDYREHRLWIIYCCCCCCCCYSYIIHRVNGEEMTSFLRGCKPTWTPATTAG